MASDVIYIIGISRTVVRTKFSILFGADVWFVILKKAMIAPDCLPLLHQPKVSDGGMKSEIIILLQKLTKSIPKFT